MGFINILKKIGVGKKSLVNEFAVLMSLSILATVIFMSGYNIYIAGKISDFSKVQDDMQNQAFASVIFEQVKKGIDSNNYESLRNFCESLKDNNLILYVNAVDSKSNKYIWSSIPELIGKNADEKDILYNKYFADEIDISKENVQQVVGKTNNYTISIGFYSITPLVTLIDTLYKNSLILSLAFMIIGLVFAFLMARIATRPMKNLLVGAEELSKGNLDYKINLSTYDEVDKLIDAFNKMAEKLSQLYSSLEQQVKDRTKELELKSEQLERAYNELQEAEVMLVHNEKMRSLGELIAGITHEINNPVNYIYGNLIHLNNYVNDLIKVIQAYEETVKTLPEKDIESVNNLKEEIEYSFIVQDLPDLIKSCRDGAERCKNIISALKNFSRLDELAIKYVNIHQEIESCLNILYSKYKNRIQVHKEFETVPMVESYAGQLNQVFMNILDNAAYAIAESGDVYIRTRQDGNEVVMEFEDTGSGIPQENVSKIFDPFFTTKPVGKGTGLGMSISYKIVKSHKGHIDVKSEPGKGTKFTLRIPVSGLKDN